MNPPNRRCQSSKALSFPTKLKVVDAEEKSDEIAARLMWMLFVTPTSRMTSVKGNVIRAQSKS